MKRMIIKATQTTPKLLFMIFLATSFFYSDLALAQQKFVRGQGVDSSKEGALQKARVAAWRNYLGMLEGAKLDNIIANEKRFLESLERYLGSVSIVEEKCDGRMFEKCEVSIKATINESLIDNALRQVSRSEGNSQSSMSGSGEDIAFLLMARVLDEGTRYETKVTKRAESTVSTKGAVMSSEQSQAGKAAGAESQQDEASVTQSSKSVTGGSEQVKRDRNVYAPWGNISDLQNAIQETLNNNKIQPLGWTDLMADCGLPDSQPFSRLYAESETGELPASVRLDIFQKLRERCKSGPVPKIIIGQIEIDSYRTDPGTGLWLATGNININVYDISRRGRGLGSANRTFSGRAATKQDAARNALASSAKIAADVIINQVNLR